MKLSSRHYQRGFTLLELLVTMAIIAILAAMSFSGLGYVRRKQNDQKATIQINLLSSILEDYKLDNGEFPPTADSTNGIKVVRADERSIDVFDTNTPRIAVKLFDLLYQYGVTNNSKIYLPSLDPANNKQGWTSTVTGNDIVDPWGKPYRYRSAYDSSNPPVMNANTVNPDFDLWSSGADKNNATAGDNISNF